MIGEIPDRRPSAYEVDSDADKKLLVIRYRGRVGPPDVEACAAQVANALAQMTPGFRLLVDLTPLESMDVACVSHLEEIMQLCDAKGISAVIRVVPEARRDIGLQIMSRFHYRRTVELVTCKTLDEAAALLTDPSEETEMPANAQHD